MTFFVTKKLITLFTKSPPPHKIYYTLSLRKIYDTSQEDLLPRKIPQEDLLPPPSRKGNCSQLVVSGCGGEYNAGTSGVIRTPAHPTSYYNNANCTWLLTADSGKVVQLKSVTLRISSALGREENLSAWIFAFFTNNI